jgi:UDP-glucose-4-epimerase GalE
LAKILVAGGAGYVGSHCVKALHQAGHECVVYDSLIRGHREFVRWGELIVGDIRDADCLGEVLSAGRFDAVLHFAALAYVGESVADPSAYYDVNVNGTRVLLDAMRQAGLDKIVFSSTCAVYGSPPVVPINEATPLNPINPYGFSKLVCERMMEDMDRANGLRSIRLRYFNAAGADPDGEIGESHDPETHLIPLVLQAAAGLSSDIAVFGDDHATPDGSCVRDYIHVADLGQAHRLAVERLLAGAPSTAINLGAGEGLSVFEVIRAAERVTGRSIPVRIAPRREGDPPNLVADLGAARRLLDWTPVRSDAEAILADAWRWAKAEADRASRPAASLTAV